MGGGDGEGEAVAYAVGEKERWRGARACGVATDAPLDLSFDLSALDLSSPPPPEEDAGRMGDIEQGGGVSGGVGGVVVLRIQASSAFLALSSDLFTGT
jgi:hypothetical protein